MNRRLHRSWHEQSTNAKKHQYIRIKNRIRGEAHKGRLFYSPHVLDEKDEWFEPTMSTDHFWFDAYFLSKKNRLFFNGDIISAGYRALENIRQQVSRDVYQLYPELKNAFDWERCPSDKKGFIEMRFKNSDLIKQYREIHARMTREFIDNHQIFVVDCTCIIDHTYRHGVGLSVVIPQVKFTVADFNKWIEKFWANGELPQQTTVTLTQQDLKDIFSHLYIGENDESIGVSETN